MFKGIGFGVVALCAFLVLSGCLYIPENRPKPVNVAYGGQVAVSSVMSDTYYRGENLVDGNKTVESSRWISGTQLPHWCEITFSHRATIEEVRLYFFRHWHQGSAQDYYGVDYCFEVFDGERWHVLLEVEGNDQLEPVYSFAPVVVERLRITFTKASVDTRVRLYEVEAMGYFEQN